MQESRSRMLAELIQSLNDRNGVYNNIWAKDISQSDPALVLNFFSPLIYGLIDKKEEFLKSDRAEKSIDYAKITAGSLEDGDWEPLSQRVTESLASYQLILEGLEKNPLELLVTGRTATICRWLLYKNAYKSSVNVQDSLIIALDGLIFASVGEDGRVIYGLTVEKEDMEQDSDQIASESGLNLTQKSKKPPSSSGIQQKGKSILSKFKRPDSKEKVRKFKKSKKPKSEIRYDPMEDADSDSKGRLTIDGRKLGSWENSLKKKAKKEYEQLDVGDRLKATYINNPKTFSHMLSVNNRPIYKKIARKKRVQDAKAAVLWNAGEVAGKWSKFKHDRAETKQIRKQAAAWHDENDPVVYIVL